jgi:hypothetical protein
MAEAGFARLRPVMPVSRTRRPKLERTRKRARDFGRNGGGGNRTRVRGRTGQSFYRFSSRFEFRPDGRCVSRLPPG